MTGETRVRYAPSPTGEPHVGNIRTAIFNWLFAQRTGGAFIIRIEDTDQARKVEGATEDLLESLKWLGLDWDEGPDVGGDYGPYSQSQRLDLYHHAVEGLLETGNAYRCYCTPKRLAEMRREQAEVKGASGYDRRCRGLGRRERHALESGGAASVVRFAMPLDGVTKVTDLIRGEVSFENRLIDDFVMLKSDGFPTYHLANVVDDHAMEITHVLRADEWLASTPRHLLIYRAMGWELPQFAHLPMILAPDKSKLSKRHGATSVLEYRKMGYLPSAMVNFLALLGWSLDNKTEILPPRELIRHFSLGRVAKSAAVFSSDKLNWMNGHYIRQMAPGELADALLDYWRAYPPAAIPELPRKDFVLRIVPLIRERLKTLRDAAAVFPFFFNPVLQYDAGDLIQRRMDETSTKLALERSLATLRAIPTFDAQSIEGALRPLADELGIKVGQLLGTLRVATTGQKVAPPLFQTMEVLGRGRVVTAIREALERL